MKKTVQKSLDGETLYSTHRVESVPLNEIIWMPIAYIFRTLNLQRILFFSSFLTYGVGDGVTAVHMMNKAGVMREINPIARYLYASSGKQGVITLKVWFALVILFMVWIVGRRTNTYWTINGFLFALTMGGIMAMRANVMAAYDMVPPSPRSIITTFLFMVVLFVMMGDMMDKLHSGDKDSQVF